MVRVVKCCKPSYLSAFSAEARRRPLPPAQQQKKQKERAESKARARSYLWIGEHEGNTMKGAKLSEACQPIAKSTTWYYLLITLHKRSTL